MKKLSIVCLVVWGLALMGVPASAQQYEVDAYPVGRSGDGVMDTELFTGVCSTFCLDVYLTGTAAPGTQPIAGGVYLDYSGSAGLMSYVSVTDAVPPWFSAPTVNEPEGPGTFWTKVTNLFGAPVDDGLGNILVTTVCFYSEAGGDVSLQLCAGKCDGTGATFWGPNPPYDDATITANTSPLVIHNSCGCSTDMDCQDGRWCNGFENCDEQCCICYRGTPPCDDGNECTTDLCDEDSDTCGDKVCAEETFCYTDPCMLDPICQEVGCLQHCDADCDLREDTTDNCPNTPNALYWGTCTRGNIGQPCDSDSQCDTEMGADNGFCSMNQEDNYPPGGNGIGDACDCEGDFDCDETLDVDAEDLTLFITDFGREESLKPCGDPIWGPCNGDFDCDVDVDSDDLTLFLNDFGRESSSNPCPPCEAGDWCVYEE